MQILDILLKLGMATILGGLVGIEREMFRKPAGIRTHVLVSVGSCLMMLLSKSFSSLPGADPSRIAAGVVTGIGFLGAGIIIHYGGNIKGLTTAASLWVVCGMGLAVGFGYWTGAIITTLIVLFVLVFLKALRNKIFRRGEYKGLEIVIPNKPGQLGKIGNILGEMDINISNIELKENGEDTNIDLVLEVPKGINEEQIIEKLNSEIKDVKKINWEG